MALASQIGAHSGALERVSEGAFFPDVAETCDLQVEPSGPEPLEIGADRVRTSDGQD